MGKQENWKRKTMILEYGTRLGLRDKKGQYSNFLREIDLEKEHICVYNNRIKGYLAGTAFDTQLQEALSAEVREILEVQQWENEYWQCC